MDIFQYIHIKSSCTLFVEKNKKSKQRLLEEI